ncbi:Mitochondrial inner membrane i-AAA protease supercomplex subunit YME1 [Wickerhamiella sorbophila]|uniref:Mitochondrial inner membrane i-AAA protease supercomplex subunit YME1 n=1 Tax=Wickerhamiella sorbophila TaxID=45607 RepID=A0A2T0FQ44_9ASCO|nr:Mitochondrial inner membrane i-AAA protease supercomplex subunit YME1 [Wickerhamiella sorbophila]PRT57112.1 Mitochondrial inner membrane i-AAA protease supercomplex subunit YME1 [Wickerhamiella sorbophila]
MLRSNVMRTNAGRLLMSRLARQNVFHQPARSLFWGPTPTSQTPPAGGVATSSQQLASKEQAANRSLSDAEAQASFYRTLLAASYPQLVVSRYESPGVARNPECDGLYVQALRNLGHTTKAAEAEQRFARTASTAGQVGANPFNVEGTSQRGTTLDPVHVVVSEKPMAMLLKWIKWLLPMGLALYAINLGFSFLTESSSIIKGAAGQDLGAAKLDNVRGEKSKVRFSDVQGVDEAREELEEIVEFLKDPSKFTGLGGKLPKGVLLTGPPGTGKTLLARAVAGEAGVPFFFMSGSEFDELYVGIGAKRIRALFGAARKAAPAIVFIDELDAIGGKRNPKDQAYSKQTLNQLLVDLDGFNQTSGVIFLAATNFPELLDKALTRPGRFDKIVNVELPDVRGRAAILNHHMKNVEISNNVNVMNLARGTPGFSGADLMNLVNQAALHASKEKALTVNMNHFEWAKDKILLGGERRTMVMTEETRKNTAFHEAGHAIMALYTPGATPLYKATILPRGRALGITFQLPELDKYDQTLTELKARLDVCMGGRIAEEMINGPENVTSGCSSDLKNATSVARAMVTLYGMSEKIGPISLGEEWSEWSASTRHMAEDEIRSLLVESENRTRSMLSEKSVELERLAHGLIEFETLDKEDIVKVVKGQSLDRDPHCTNTVVSSEAIRDKRAHLNS